MLAQSWPDSFTFTSVWQAKYPAQEFMTLHHIANTGIGSGVCDHPFTSPPNIRIELIKLYHWTTNLVQSVALSPLAQTDAQTGAWRFKVLGYPLFLTSG
jgi:hypothetical protein